MRVVVEQQRARLGAARLAKEDVSTAPRPPLEHPPLAGFFAKYFVFLAAIKAGLYVLAVLGVLASVVGAYYYLVIIKIMYFDEPAKSFQSMPGLLRIVLGIAGLINILFFVYPAPLLGAATAAAKSLF